LINIVLISIILAIIIILASIMLIPFHIILNFSNKGLKFQGDFKVTWIGIKILRRKIPSENEKPTEKEEKNEEGTEKAKWDVDRILKVFNLFLDAFPYLKKIFQAFSRSFTLERFHFDLTMGLDSPVDTAQLSGLLWSFSSVVNVIPRVNIQIRPEFIETKLDGHVEVEVKLKLLWIVLELMRAYTKKPVRNLINEVRS